MRRHLVGFATLVAVGAASVSRAELVFNGGFETGNFSGWFVPPNVPPPNPNASNFRVEPGGGHSGTYYAQLSSAQLQFMSQILPTQAGTDYELSFWLRREDLLFAGLSVRWEGQTVLNVLGGPPLPWTQFTIPLHANITGSFLEFGQSAFPFEYHIDDISVTVIPAPPAAPLLAAAGLLALKRRRR